MASLNLLIAQCQSFEVFQNTQKILDNLANTIVFTMFDLHKLEVQMVARLFYLANTVAWEEPRDELILQDQPKDELTNLCNGARKTRIWSFAVELHALCSFTKIEALWVSMKQQMTRHNLTMCKASSTWELLYPFSVMYSVPCDILFFRKVSMFPYCLSKSLANMPVRCYGVKKQYLVKKCWHKLNFTLKSIDQHNFFSHMSIKLAGL